MRRLPGGVVDTGKHWMERERGWRVRSGPKVVHASHIKIQYQVFWSVTYNLFNVFFSLWAKSLNSETLLHLLLFGEPYCTMSCQQVINGMACLMPTGSSSSCLRKCYLIQEAVTESEGNPAVFHAAVGYTLRSLGSGDGAAAMMGCVGYSYPHISHWRAWTRGRSPGIRRSQECWRRPRWDRSWGPCTHPYLLREKERFKCVVYKKICTHMEERGVRLQMLIYTNTKSLCHRLCV